MYDTHSSSTCLFAHVTSQHVRHERRRFENRPHSHSETPKERRWRDATRRPAAD